MLNVYLLKKGPPVEVLISGALKAPERKSFPGKKELEAFLKGLEEAGETVKLTGMLKRFLGITP